MNEPVKFFLYEGRHGERILTPHTRECWDYLISELERDDGMTIEESREEGFDVSGGTYEEGYVSCDDGGTISTLELEYGR